MPFRPFVPFADVAEVVLQFDQQGAPWNLTLGFKFGAAISLGDLVALQAEIDAWWSTQLYSMITPNCTLQNIKITDLTSQFAPTYSAPPASVNAGIHSGATLAAETAMVVTFHTANRGRSFRGRNYVAGRVQPDLATVSRFSAGTIAAMLAIYQDLPAEVGPGGWSHVVLSRQVNSVRRTTGVATLVTSYEPKAKVASIRNRVH